MRSHGECFYQVLNQLSVLEELLWLQQKGIYQKRVKARKGEIENIKDDQVKQNGATPSGQEGVARTPIYLLLEATKEWKRNI